MLLQGKIDWICDREDMVTESSITGFCYRSGLKFIQ